ncbi:type II toxin-antitoxin system RelE/ParE family toxin [Lelliottia amnigena]|uniref:type II toxin-antitoxin system RelE/ParE family toxin n=1 Tax=Lelliottia amnigena TaxID=61646 RepID=UPI001F3FB48A|nr:type II toxin-antitoxin system RelE/ParE family toxin [Lelliottia amnigena]UJD92999.1 type II toxin-antitoxin system RelE/ParE family toxin [Lelliottia amnigena]
MKEIVQTESFRRWEQNVNDPRAKTLIAARLFRLANGLPGDVRPVGEGISELRIHYGPGYRIYFKSQGNTLIILLSGGNKNSQDKDIILAKTLARSLKHREFTHHD